MRESKASKEQIEHRRKAMAEYKVWKGNADEEFDAEKEERLALRNGINYRRILLNSNTDNSIFMMNHLLCPICVFSKKYCG